jgi:YHS domain-containing protein
VPRLLGCDPVVLYRTDRAMSGSTEFGAYFDGGLYLFTAPETRTEFKEHPMRYTRTRHVLRPDDFGGTKIE